jgi:hypothetical protein
MNNLREVAYRIDPALWVREVLGVTPTGWQERFLRAPRGESILALTARQVGKTTTASLAIAHAMLFTPGSLSVIACPATARPRFTCRRCRPARHLAHRPRRQQCPLRIPSNVSNQSQDYNDYDI